MVKWILDILWIKHFIIYFMKILWKLCRCILARIMFCRYKILPSYFLARLITLSREGDNTFPTTGCKPCEAGGAESFLWGDEAHWLSCHWRPVLEPYNTNCFASIQDMKPRNRDFTSEQIKNTYRWVYWWIL